ncbi:helix-turn-helix domain-containing protein [Chitinophaga pendula]|uniref:hypothetical protein n=1 Tax=Chitinophaga TaxID=79328 RepID=UPI0012FD49A3|nr:MULTISPECIES: hypothetical protein [Chitinophaga]UCJ07810.1 helix-turn-helix domain-containing protein [Chitinophaga pendula]
MQAIQIMSITADQFVKIVSDAARVAADEAVAAVLHRKTDLNEDVTVSLIAKEWGVSKQTVKNRIDAHKVPYCKLGREVAIKRKWLDTIKTMPRKDI